MDKKNFAEQLYQAVDNGSFMGDSKDEILAVICRLLTAVVPKDREKFAQWGYPSQQSTAKECWDETKYYDILIDNITMLDRLKGFLVKAKIKNLQEIIDLGGSAHFKKYRGFGAHLAAEMDRIINKYTE